MLQQNPQGQSSPARASPMNHASPMGVNHPSPHMQSHMASPSMQQHMHMNQQHQQQQQQQNPAKNDDYNLDFLDSIPNDDSGPSENGQKQNHPQQQTNSSGGQDDDLMNLLDS